MGGWGVACFRGPGHCLQLTLGPRSWIVAVKHLFEGLDSWSYTELAVTGELLATGELKPQISGVLGGGFGTLTFF